MPETVEMGVTVLVKCATAAAPTVFLTVGGQKGATLHEERDATEVTTKACWPNRAYKPGFGTWTVSCDGMIVATDAGMTALREAFHDGLEVKLQMIAGTAVGCITYEGMAIIKSNDLEFPMEDGATFAIEFQGNGDLTHTAKIA